MAKKIMVVDDDPDWRAFVTEALASIYTVVSASTGRDGVWNAKRSRPAAIVLAVECRDRRLGFVVGTHFDEPKALRAARVTIGHHLGAHHRAMCLEQRLEIGAAR